MTTLKTIASFTGADGGGPEGGLIADANGDLFGTTNGGGSNDDGTVFEIPKTASGYGPITVLANFSGANGAGPGAGLIADASGDLFGTTGFGGVYGAGTVFEIPKSASGYGPVTTLASFSNANGNDPEGGLIVDANGDLFGTTAFGGVYGDGTVFEISKTASGYGSVTDLASFNGVNGDRPVAGLMADANGDLFGTTVSGGSDSSGDGYGTVFEIPYTAGSGYGPVTVIATFSSSNGAGPDGGLIADANGDLFGTTNGGGSNNDGTVFEIPKTASGYGPVTTLANFSGTNGEFPAAGLLADAKGDLFGTTSGGGSNNDGTVFEIPKTASGYGPVAVLASSSGGYPSGLIADANGDLLGTTFSGGSKGDGTAFEITGAGFVRIWDYSGGATSAIVTANGVNYVNSSTDAGQTLRGKALVGDTVSLYNNGALVASGIAVNSSGDWSYQIGPLSDGSYSYTATASAAGVTSTASGALKFKVDLTPPTSTISETVTLGGGTISETVSGIAKDKGSGVAFVGGIGIGAASLGANGAWSLTDAGLGAGANASFEMIVTDNAGNWSDVSSGEVTVNSATNIALSHGKGDHIVISSAAGGNTINVTGETSDSFVYKQTISQFDTITGFVGGAGKTHDAIDLSGIAGATTYQGSLAGVLNPDSVGWVYNAAQNETSVYLNNTSAAESLTGASAAAPMLELAGHVTLGSSNFTLAKA